MESKNTSLTIAALRNHIERVIKHGLTQSEQLNEINNLRDERLSALSEVSGGLKKFLNEIPRNVPERDVWQRTQSEAERILKRINGDQR